MAGQPTPALPELGDPGLVEMLSLSGTTIIESDFVPEGEVYRLGNGTLVVRRGFQRRLTLAALDRLWAEIAATLRKRMMQHTASELIGRLQEQAGPRNSETPARLPARVTPGHGSRARARARENRSSPL